jgi:hypothetical protein
MTRTELEWERVRTSGVGAGFTSSGSGASASAGPSLYDMLKQRDEQSATEEEERSKGLGLPKTLDEDGTWLYVLVSNLQDHFLTD